MKLIFFGPGWGKVCASKRTLDFKTQALAKKNKNQKHQSNQKGSKKEKNRDG